MELGVILPRINPGEYSDTKWSDLDAPTMGNRLRRSTIKEAATTLEELGFDSLWVTDSIGRGFPNPDPLITLTAAAMVTSKVSLGISVLQLAIRNPVALAHQIMSTHLFVGERLLLGIGAGSTETDFNATGTPFEERFTLFEKAIETMRRLWNGETVDGTCLYPFDSTLGGPAILIGSWGGSKWVSRAAVEFDGWIGSARKTSWRTIEKAIVRYRDAGGERAVLTNVQIDPYPNGRADEPDSPDRELGPCGPELGMERLHRLSELGFDEVILRTWDHTDDTLGRLAELAREALG